MLAGNTVRSPNNAVEVAVLVGGVEQPLYRRPWDGKLFVVGTPGVAYTLHVRNLTNGRIEVINTVDGRHTLDDEPGDTQRNRGLIITGVGEITGWRISDKQTRQFVFGDPEHSIAALATGTTSNVGVIGFAVHRERPRLSLGGFGVAGYYGDAAFGSKNSYGAGATRGGSLGTGMGASVEDVVGYTTFVRDGAKPDILVIGYDTEEVLRKQGIIAPAEADPFPGAQTGYAQYAQR